MKEQGIRNIGFAAALLGTLPYSKSWPTSVAWIAVITVLLATAFVLLVNEQLSGRVGKKMVTIAANVKITYLAFGFGMVMAGVNLLKAEWPWWWLVLMVVGAFFIVGTIGSNLWDIIKRLRAKKTSPANS
ncbi:MAG: hypothetical protein HYX90_06795 [Chloroflexi bacterium]|nr:hypothetical protein [Chloroflexota bacterium]